MLSSLTPLICTLGALGSADTAAAEVEGLITLPAALVAPVVEKVKWNDSLGVATVSGTIKFKGDAPARAVLDTSSDGKCHGPEVLDETVIVSDAGGLKNVFVWISDGVKDYKFETPTEPAILTQKGCVYVPHVLGVMEKQPLQIRNEDATTHNVHSFSKKNKGFNQAQPEGAPALEKEFKRDEGLFQIKCDMHAWMGCWVAVVDSPFFAVSDDAGNFTLPKMPAGTFELSIKHESLGTQKKTITIVEGADQALEFTLE